MSRKSIQLLSPAKINLSLEIGQPAEGASFHPLVSLVAPLDWGDSIKLSWDPEGTESNQLEINHPDLRDPSKNLAIRAAESFRTIWPFRGSLLIHIDKRIPTGAGLGGGSSNAATVLRSLARLTGLVGEDSRELLEVAAALGSDCPLFLLDGPSLMQGRGEQLKPLDSKAKGLLKGLHVLLIVPSFSIGTSEAYSALRNNPRYYSDLSEALKTYESWKTGKIPLEALCRNTFSQWLWHKFLFYPTLDEDLRIQLKTPLFLSGSGSCCYVIIRNENSLQLLENVVKNAIGSHGFTVAASFRGL